MGAPSTFHPVWKLSHFHNEKRLMFGIYSWCFETTIHNENQQVVFLSLETKIWGWFTRVVKIKVTDSQNCDIFLWYQNCHCSNLNPCLLVSSWRCCAKMKLKSRNPLRVSCEQQLNNVSTNVYENTVDVPVEIYRHCQLQTNQTIHK